MKKLILGFWMVVIVVGAGLILHNRDPLGLGHSLRKAMGFAIGWPPDEELENRDSTLNIKQEILDLIAWRDSSTYKNHLNELAQKIKSGDIPTALDQINDILFKNREEDTATSYRLKNIAMLILVELPVEETENLLKKIIEDEPIDNNSADENPLLYYNLMGLKRMAIIAMEKDADYIGALIDEPDKPGINHDVYLTLLERMIAADEEPLEAIKDLRSRVKPGTQHVLDGYESP